MEFKILGIKLYYNLQEYAERYGIYAKHSHIQCVFNPQENRQNLAIYPDGYYCHACGAKGDIINFVAHMEGISNKQAVKKLTDEMQDVNVRSACKKYKAQLAKSNKQKWLAKILYKQIIDTQQRLYFARRMVARQKLCWLLNNTNFDDMDPYFINLMSALEYKLLQLEIELERLNDIENEQKVMERKRNKRSR